MRIEDDWGNEGERAIAKAIAATFLHAVSHANVHEFMDWLNQQGYCVMSLDELNRRKYEDD